MRTNLTRRPGSADAILDILPGNYFSRSAPRLATASTLDARRAPRREGPAGVLHESYVHTEYALDMVEKRRFRANASTV